MDQPSRISAHSVTMDAIGQIADASDRIIAKLQSLNMEEGGSDSLPQKTFSMAEVSRMLNRSAAGIRKAEKEGRLQPPELKEDGRRAPYTLPQINAMRDYWNCRPGRKEGDEAIRFSFQNFKGGVGKSTLACHCAQYLARAGYRVLLVDCDSQGSSTVTFGFQPDKDVLGGDTLLPFLQGDKDNLDYCIRSTHWEGVDLIPACLALYSAEYFLASVVGRGGAQSQDWLGRLDAGLGTVQHHYDVLIIDPPPALGLISLSVLRSLDGLIVPTPPSMYDFHSTGAFFRMLEQVMDTLSRSYGEAVDLDFLKILVSKKITGRHAHEFVSDLMSSSYGNNVLATPFVQSAEIDNASSEWKTVYDLEGPTSSRATYKRCLECLDSVFGQVDELLNAVWASRRIESTLSTRLPG